MSNEKSEFEKVIRREADLHRRIAEARFKPADPAVEKPSDVAAAFMAEAFDRVKHRMPEARFTKSNRTIRIDRGDLSFSYSFKASSKNTAGVSVRLWPYAAVQSKALKRWRKSAPDPRNLEGRLSTPWRDSGVVIYGMLGNMIEPKAFYELELIQPEGRSELAADVAERIGAVDGILSAAFTDFGTLAAFAAREEWAFECPSDHVCEYIASRWGFDAVSSYAEAVVSIIPDGRATLAEKITNYDPVTNPRSISRVTRLDGLARFHVANRLAPPR